MKQGKDGHLWGTPIWKTKADTPEFPKNIRKEGPLGPSVQRGSGVTLLLVAVVEGDFLVEGSPPSPGTQVVGLDLHSEVATLTVPTSDRMPAAGGWEAKFSSRTLRLCPCWPCHATDPAAPGFQGREARPSGGGAAAPVAWCLWLLSDWAASTVRALGRCSTNSQSLLKLMSIESVMPSNCLLLCRPFSCLQSFPASGSFQMS